jgi:hypothetical protein
MLPPGDILAKAKFGGTFYYGCTITMKSGTGFRPNNYAKVINLLMVMKI